MLVLDLDRVSRLHLARAIDLYRRRLRADGQRLPARLDEFAEALSDTARQEPTPVGAEDVAPQDDDVVHVLELDEVAARLRLSTRQVERLVADGELPVVRIGRAVRVDPDDLKAFIAARRTAKEAA